ncbi:myb-like protein D [Galleria mellonella]|uniref:Myb-like protein D n=1 Tax=Galleria mellonella TaxID=7137 RepID=A0A6J1WZM4_GALME|nr:myb-like protein D [Galleria mellonella]
MIDDNLIISEKVYLCKKSNIYVDHGSLLHHQVEGIRFLYRQFVKKTPGVIFNEPADCFLQVALFINAIVKGQALDKPVLILCNDSDLEVWSQHFQNRVSGNEIVVEETNVFLKKKIFINSMKKLDILHRGNWSIIVVNDDTFLQYKQTHPKYKADFKIWLTTIDIKENLRSFTLIYKWFYSKEKENLDIIKDWYENKKSDIREWLTQTIRIEAVLEDILWRRTNVLTPNIPQNQPVNKVRRKNKDATGTKIKRSRKIIEDNTENPILKKINNTDLIVATSSDNANDRIENHYNEGSIGTDNKDKTTIVVENYIGSNINSHRQKINNILQHREEESSNELDFKITNETDASIEIRTNNIVEDLEEEDMKLNYSDEILYEQEPNEKELEQNQTETPMEIDGKNEINVVSEEKVVKECNNDNINDTLTDNSKNNVLQQKTNDKDATQKLFESSMEIDSKEDSSAAVKAINIGNTNGTAVQNEIKVKTKSRNQCFDTKLQEMEEKAMKKFKGSLLDSIF